MAREVAVRYVEGSNPEDQEKLMQAMSAEGWEVAGWGSVTGIITSAIDNEKLAGTVGFMLYFGRDKTAALAAELMEGAQADAKSEVAQGMQLSRRERRALERTKAI